MELMRRVQEAPHPETSSKRLPFALRQPSVQPRQTVNKDSMLSLEAQLAMRRVHVLQVCPADIERHLFTFVFTRRKTIVEDAWSRPVFDAWSKRKRT